MIISRNRYASAFWAAAAIYRPSTTANPAPSSAQPSTNTSTSPSTASSIIRLRQLLGDGDRGHGGRVAARADPQAMRAVGIDGGIEITSISDIPSQGTGWDRPVPTPLGCSTRCTPSKADW
ncbi:MAG: hypothetical protein R2856_34725 [Caldilineaceae bacterium]